MDDDANLLELIEQRAGRPECSVCAGSDWALVKDGKPITFLSFEAKDDPRVRVLALACRNCGYLRFHSVEALET
jgi:hypothetical protein